MSMYCKSILIACLIVIPSFAGAADSAVEAKPAAQAPAHQPVTSASIAGCSLIPLRVVKGAAVVQLVFAFVFAAPAFRIPKRCWIDAAGFPNG